MVLEKAFDFLDKKFSFIKVFEDMGVINGHRTVRGLCDCGVIKNFRLSHLKAGKIKSCGCYNVRLITYRASSHRLSKHPLYKIWAGMRQRCYDKNSPNYKRYGARGVRVCEEWLNDFVEFYEWAIKNGWKKGLQIDKDAYGVGGLFYSPETCKVVTRKENNRRMRSSFMIEYNGQVKNLSEWCEILNINYSLVIDRLLRGWNIIKAFETKSKKGGGSLTNNGETKLISAWCKEYKISKSTLWARINVLHWPIGKSIKQTIR